MTRRPFGLLGLSALVLAVSDRLSGEERMVAKAMAAQKVRDGAHAVVLGELDVYSVVREVA